MTLYADILFLVNFVMNAFVLFLAARVLRVGRKWWFVLAGAGLMAGLYTILLALPVLRGVNVFVAQVVILMAGIGVAFWPRGWRLFLRYALVTYVISFTVGGLGMALFFLTDLPYAVRYIAADLGAFSRAVSWQLAVTGMVLSYGLIKLGQFFIERRTLKRQMLCNVQIALDDGCVAFDALVDTGHSLREPITQSPVIVAELDAVAAFLPEGLRTLFSDKREAQLGDLLAGEGDAFYARLRMVPFTSIGKANGMLVGFRPDSVTVRPEDVGASSPRKDIIIGIYNNKLTRDGRYHGLVGAELVA
ncbi:MAG: sigma-E processing peptidase SpoIIGA [Defluviitaleaceae bacterium]|nr:sigma-E processing peptidase SpoIIGA [Defluviitaleaceae bacterium]